MDAIPLEMSAPTGGLSHESRGRGIILSYSLLRKNVTALSIGYLTRSGDQAAVTLLVGRGCSSPELSDPKGQLKLIDLLSVQWATCLSVRATQRVIIRLTWGLVGGKRSPEAGFPSRARPPS